MPAPLRPLLALVVVIALVLLIVVLAAWWAEQQRSAAPPATSAPTPAVAPAPPDASGPLCFRPVHRNRQLHVLDGPHFTIGYDEERRDPAWVAYQLGGPVLHRGPEPTRPQFATDFRTSAHVASRDYSGSGFDRGHMCPAYAMWSRNGEEAFLATFTMANVIPQPHALNAGLWEDLESDIAAPGGWAERHGPLWVIDGPAFAERPERLRNGTAIPAACFMIVVEPRAPRAIAWLVPNRAETHGPAQRWMVPIRTIEKATGLDLFAGAAEPLRAKLEDALPDAGAWR